MPTGFLTAFTDVITFDGAYSLFPAQYDEEPDGPPKPMYRSFSDCASWVVTFEQFEQKQISSPDLAFGTSLLARHPLYTSSLLASPLKGHHIEWYRDVQLSGVVLRSRLLWLTHVMCCAELSHLVQQFLTRLVIAHPGRSNS